MNGADQYYADAHHQRPLAAASSLSLSAISDNYLLPTRSPYEPRGSYDDSTSGRFAESLPISSQDSPSRRLYGTSGGRLQKEASLDVGHRDQYRRNEYSPPPRNGSGVAGPFDDYGIPSRLAQVQCAVAVLKSRVDRIPPDGLGNGQAASSLRSHSSFSPVKGESEQQQRSPSGSPTKTSDYVVAGELLAELSSVSLSLNELKGKIRESRSKHGVAVDHIVDEQLDGETKSLARAIAWMESRVLGVLGATVVPYASPVGAGNGSALDLNYGAALSRATSTYIAAADGPVQRSPANSGDAFSFGKRPSPEELVEYRRRTAQAREDFENGVMPSRSASARRELLDETEYRFANSAERDYPTIASLDERRAAIQQNDSTIKAGRQMMRDMVAPQFEEYSTSPPDRSRSRASPARSGSGSGSGKRGSVSQREINGLATADDILEVVQDRYGYTHHSPRSSAHHRHRSASGGVGEATTVRSLELSKGTVWDILYQPLPGSVPAEALAKHTAQDAESAEREVSNLLAKMNLPITNPPPRIPTPEHVKENRIAQEKLMAEEEKLKKAAEEEARLKKQLEEQEKQLAAEKAEQERLAAIHVDPEEFDVVCPTKPAIEQATPEHRVLPQQPAQSATQPSQVALSQLKSTEPQAEVVATADSCNDNNSAGNETADPEAAACSAEVDVAPTPTQENATSSTPTANVTSSATNEPPRDPATDCHPPPADDAMVPVDSCNDSKGGAEVAPAASEEAATIQNTPGTVVEAASMEHAEANAVKSSPDEDAAAELPTQAESPPSTTDGHRSSWAPSVVPVKSDEGDTPADPATPDLAIVAQPETTSTTVQPETTPENQEPQPSCEKVEVESTSHDEKSSQPAVTEPPVSKTHDDETVKEGQDQTGKLESDDPVTKALAFGDWHKKKDEKSGRTYYYNSKTKETTWNLAKKLASTSPEPAQVESAENSGANNDCSRPTIFSMADEELMALALSSGRWKELHNADGRPYYCNTATKETTWNLAKHLKEHPEEMEPLDAFRQQPEGASADTHAKPNACEKEERDDPVAKALESGDWHEKKDEKSGRTYYYNSKTKETTWNLAKKLAE